MILTDFGGQLCVELYVSKGCVNDVVVRSTRPKNVASVFVGHRPHEVVQTVGTLFSLCRQAQTAASLTAFEKALKVDVAPAQMLPRELVRLAEMFSQTALRLCLDWHTVLGLDVERDLMRTALAGEGELERALFQGQPWNVLGGVAMDPDMDGIKEIVGTLQGRVQTFNAAPANALRRALSDLPLKDFGQNLRIRLDARIDDLTRLPPLMLAAYDRLVKTGVGDQVAQKSGRGEACVDTARGPLTHRVAVREGRVQGYEIAAPTDVNFAPDGPVVSGLLGLKFKDLNTLKQAAKLYVSALDPCVAYEVEVIDA